MRILSGLTNSQVLQRIGARGANAKIEGAATKGGRVSATILQAGRPLKGWKKKTVGKAARGKFAAALKGIPAGGPYRLRLEVDGEGVEVASFFVGDVWVLAGQSNMEGVGNTSGAAKPHPLIRAFLMSRQWQQAREPLHILQESPDVCHHGGNPISPEAAEKERREKLKGTGVGVFFSREMLKRSGVPQGLICTAHGGTSMTQWDPERKNLGEESLYYSMVESVRATGQPVAGVLWYQGESDADPASNLVYTERMQKLLAASRKDFRLPKLPWIIVQIGRFFNMGVNPVHWNNIQEQQRVLPEKIKYLETVPAVDLPMDDWIHIGAAGFVTLGDRMARVADRMVYGNKKEMGPPRLKEIRHCGPTSVASQGLEVIFDNVVGGLKSLGEPDGFSLVYPDGSSLPHFYKTTLQGNSVRLDLQAKVSKDMRLSYGYGYTPHCNITDGRGFALPVFGPCGIEGDEAAGYLPYVAQWKVSEIVAETRPLDKVPCPDFSSFDSQVKTYGEGGFSSNLDGFINEHSVWVGKTGYAYFQSKLNLGEPMKLEVLMGYDGPFKLWIDGGSFFANMKGVNPCVPDKNAKMAALKKGTHVITIGMDLKAGHTWGFFLRYRRKDVKKDKLRSGLFSKPTYSV